VVLPKTLNRSSYHKEVVPMDKSQQKIKPLNMATLVALGITATLIEVNIADTPNAKAIVFHSDKLNVKSPGIALIPVAGKIKQVPFNSANPDKCAAGLTSADSIVLAAGVLSQNYMDFISSNGADAEAFLPLIG